MFLFLQNLGKKSCKETIDIDMKKFIKLKESIADNSGEEREMIRGQLHRIHDLSAEISEMLKNEEDLPAWVQSKVAQAVQSIADVYGYIEPILGGEDCCPHCGCDEEIEDEEIELNTEAQLRNIIRDFVLLEKKKCKGTESSPVGSPRQRSFCKRMCGHMKKNTSSETASDPDSCIRQSLRRWKCRCS